MAFDIGSRIIELRTAHSLSQEALANQLSLSRQAVSRWERGEALPDTENLIALADLFGVTLDELVRPQAAGAPEEPAPEEEAADEAEPEASAEGETAADIPADIPADLSATAQGDETPVDTQPEQATTPEPEPTTPAPPSVPTYTPPSETPPAATPRDSRWTTGKVIALIVVALIAGAAILALLAHLIFGMHAPLGAIQSTSETPGVTYEAPDDSVDENDIGIDSQGVTSIDLSWPSGDVAIMPVDDAETNGDIRLLENRFDSDSADALLWGIEEGTLRVYADPGVSYIGETSLTLMIPASLMGTLGELSVEVLAGSVEVQNMKLDDLDVTIGSGFASIDGVTAHDLDLEVASGEAHVQGWFEEVDIDIMSGFAEVTVVDSSMLSELSLEVTSGGLMVNLPESTGFTLIENATGPGEVRVSGFPITYSGQTAGTVGDGATVIETEVASGSIDIVSYPD